MLVIAAVGLFVALGLGGLMFALRSSGDPQLTFVSHEPVLGDPGGRVVYYPKRQEAVVKAWSLVNLSPAQTYQVWALENGRPRSLTVTASSSLLEIDFFLHIDLSRVDEVIVTVEPAPGSFRPGNDVVVRMSREPVRP